MPMMDSSPEPQLHGLQLAKKLPPRSDSSPPPRSPTLPRSMWFHVIMDGFQGHRSGTAELTNAPSFSPSLPAMGTPARPDSAASHREWEFFWTFRVEGLWVQRSMTNMRCVQRSCGFMGSVDDPSRREKNEVEYYEQKVHCSEDWMDL